MANVYLLVTGIIQVIPRLGTTETYTTILPLLLFLSFNITCEGDYDLGRYKLEKAKNKRLMKVLYGYL